MWSLQIMPQDTCFVKKQLYRRGTAVFDAQVGQLETTITPCSRSDIHPGQLQDKHVCSQCIGRL